ncbi:MAG TPA: O-methyltransferase [Actinomycetota bacterium]|jgi:caffeoyl-CoA O-methyltransferase|nr:O-methyltransferase [Actinomycetota bacterium]
MDIVNPQIEGYMLSLLDRYDDPVLAEMEDEAERRGFPAVGRVVGVTLEVLARSIGARRVFELGSGFGYSAYWFARAVGERGDVHCTENDPENVGAGQAWLDRAGLGNQVVWHTGDALTAFGETDGEFDIVFVDIDKREYPDAWRAASERIRVGGLYICDNALGTGSTNVLEDGEVARYIREHNDLVARNERWISAIIPTREGDLVAIRIS